MTTPPFYPSLTTLLRADALPDNLGLLQDLKEATLDSLFYRNLQTSLSRDGDYATYRLILVSYASLGFTVPGTDLSILLNPSADAAKGTEIPVSLSYSWEILRYLGGVDLTRFDDSARSFFELLLAIAGVSYSEVTREIIETLEGGSIAAFITRFNASHPAAQFTEVPETTLEAFVEQFVDWLEGKALDIIDVLAGVYLPAADPQTSIAVLERLFSTWLGVLSIERIRRMLVPEVSASVDAITIGIRFPAALLREVDANGDPIDDPGNPGVSKGTLATVDVAAARYSTARGLEFDVQDSLTVNFPRSEILGTGLLLSVTGMKVDISRTTNIPEALADGRPADFVGIYITEGSVTLPAFWNQDSSSSGVIKARNLLVGTGGISGALTLEARENGAESPVITARIGDAFAISLDRFSMEFQQSAVTNSTIEGTLRIPGFTDDKGNSALIGIKGSIREDGDFDVTASMAAGQAKTIAVPGVFNLTLQSVAFGQKDDDFYLAVSGSITFTHELVSKFISGPIGIEKLMIWSDGRYEIEGGTIPLPDNVRFMLGPAEISISAIHLGTHEKADGIYRYFGFDGAIDVNPGGVDVRGKGIKFYYPEDGKNLEKRSYLEIKSLAIDLVIPGSASKESATLLISGFLNINGSSEDPEYAGGVSFALPKVRIAGGASMAYRPKIPAFVVDAFVELSTPIPLGATSLGIFGFRGLFGQRYIATKPAGMVQETDTWFDYYKSMKGKGNVEATEGIDIRKFEVPADTGGYESTLSIGAGISLATAADSGKAFSSRLFLLLSLPDLIYLEGKANIVAERVGLTGSDDPPFFAMLAITPQSVEVGAGVNYLLPQGDGSIIDLKAEMRAAFFFQNSAAWYINIGTPQNPTTARILSLFDATSYLMLSASGISMGAGVTWDFEKSYAGGAVYASVHAYIKLGGHISFERPQIGGFAMLGGYVNARLLWFGFHIGITATLVVEVPDPRYIYGAIGLCIGVTIGFWKFRKRIEKCFTVEFLWGKRSKNLAPVSPLPEPPKAGETKAFSPVGGVNMLSGETFPIGWFPTQLPGSDAAFEDFIVPLDTWIDIEFLKGVQPSADIQGRIASLSGTAPGNFEAIPPIGVPDQVTHEYSIETLEILAWTGTTWAEYRPYQAMIPPAAVVALKPTPDSYKDGFWINTGEGKLDKIRLLAETPISYMQQPDWYVPEQLGITGATLFCRADDRPGQCIDWIDVDPGTTYLAGQWQLIESAAYRTLEGNGTVLRWSRTGQSGETSGPPPVLAIANASRAVFVFDQPCSEVSLNLTTFSSGVTVRFYERDGAAYRLIERPRDLTQLQALAPIRYVNSEKPVAMVEVEPWHADATLVERLRIEIEEHLRIIYERGNDGAEEHQEMIRELEVKIRRGLERQCAPEGISSDTLRVQIDALQTAAEQLEVEVDALKQAASKACDAATKARTAFERCFPTVDVACPDHGDACWLELEVDDGKGGRASAADVQCDLYQKQYRTLYEEHSQESDQFAEECAEVTRDLQNTQREYDAIQDQLTALIGILDRLGGESVRPPQELPCSTLLHQVCWLSKADDDFNRTIPTKEAIDGDYGSTEGAIEKWLAPIWRPGTRYLLKLQVRDRVDGADTAAPPPSYFGFATEGPIGHFGSKYLAPDNGGREKTPDERLLTSLKGYIDYGRSYPNADGELIRSKPLFYEDARILLFFTKRYVYHFFGDWPAYNGLPALTGNSMEIVIRDPADKCSADSPLPPEVETTVRPGAIVSWPSDNDPRIPEDIRKLFELRNAPPQGYQCWVSDGALIKPASVYTRLKPQNLRPSKLYTAIINNIYRPPDKNTGAPQNPSNEVHRYVFQTSRYADFWDQIGSYRLQDETGNRLEAIYALNVTLTDDSRWLLFDIVSASGTIVPTPALASIADPFDRIVEGVLQQPPLDPPISTEFNILRDEDRDRVIAIWIRSPEPFNDPKLPDKVLARTIQVLEKGIVSAAYHVLFSKDRSQAFVMHVSRVIKASSLRFRFAYVEWDGSRHLDRSVVTTRPISLTLDKTECPE